MKADLVYQLFDICMFILFQLLLTGIVWFRQIKSSREWTVDIVCNVKPAPTFWVWLVEYKMQEMSRHIHFETAA